MIKIAVCDNDKDYQEIISYKIKSCMQNILELSCDIKCFSNLEELLNYCSSNKTDIIFLDIMLDSLNSMDWTADNFKTLNAPVVFITGYPQAAYNISESHCCYFLIKSRINDENLTKALRKALSVGTEKNNGQTILKTGQHNYIVNYKDIVYIESFSNNIIYHFSDSGRLTVYASLKDIEEELPSNFLRCHKSYIVNMDHIICFEPHRFILDTKEKISIPLKKYRELINIYQKYFKKNKGEF